MATNSVVTIIFQKCGTKYEWGSDLNKIDQNGSKVEPPGRLFQVATPLEIA